MGNFGYYSTMARLNPGALALAAARRVQGRARQALYRRRARLDAAGVLAAYGVTHADALAGRALDQRPSHAWCEVVRRASVRAALAELPGAAERARARARRAIAREFDVFGVRLAFGERGAIDWGLDPVSGHRFECVPLERLVLHRAGIDPKYPWELGRLDACVALAQGAWAEESPEAARACARAFVALVEDFLRDNPVGQGVHWGMPMEVALRGANLAQALAMFADAPEVRAPRFLPLALSAIAEHAAWVEAHLEDQSAIPNNHLVANHAGLLVMACLFPELPDASRQAALAAEGLRAQMAAQVNPEGTSFEGSVPYHRLALELFLMAELVARGTGVDLGRAFRERLGRMFAAARAWCSEEGLAPQVGDNDSGRALPLCDRASLDHGYLAPLGAALLGEPALAGGAFPDEAAWLTGLEGLRRFRALPPAPPPRSVSFPEAGLHVLRGAGATVTVRAGAAGQRGVGGHDHNDKLSFELHLGGRPVVVDVGSPVYTRDAKERNRFRATAAHNTLQVDGEEQAPLDPARPFALPEWTRARAEAFVPGDGLDRLVVSHEGYRALASPVRVERHFVLDRRERALGVTDVLTGTGAHEVLGRLHLPDEQVRLRPPQPHELARARRVPDAPRAFAPLAAELGPEGGARALVLFEAELDPRLEPGRYSSGYGRTAPSRVVLFGGRFPLPVMLRWVIVFR